MIDIHTHILTIWGGEQPFTEEILIKKMDELKIEKFVILPIGVSPETPYFYFGTEDVLEVYKRYPDKVIPFCNIDPRQGNNSPDTDFSWILSLYKENGCKGLGELTCQLYIDDPKCINLFKYCGKFGFPVLFHLIDKFGKTYGVVDDIYLPRLEKVLNECPETIFIGHAPAFWSEISADVTEETRNGYPEGQVKKEGKLQQLLRKYPNLYGDLSAGSGYNAISRDPEYGYKFLEEFSDKLLFGTDICHVNQQVDIIDYLKNAREKSKISETAYKKITEENAKKILKL